MIVITAPTSNIGNQVVSRLLDAGEELRLVARDPARVPGPVREHVEVVEGSHADAAVVEQAFEGAEAVFWLVPSDPAAANVRASYVDFSRPACDALVRHGVERVVGVSALGRGTPQAADAGPVTASLEMDDLIAATGVPYRALTMPSFMDNVARQVAPIRDQGAFFSPIAGDRKLPTCATRDIATVAARWLSEAGWEGFEEVPVLGPEDLSADDQAEIMSQVLGRPVRFQQIPPEAFRSNLLDRGMTEPMAQAMLDMYLAKDAGLDGGVERTPQNSTPTSFREWCEDTLRPAVEAEA